MPTLVFSKAHPTRQFHNAGSRRRYRQCARNSGGTTGNSCYTFISSKNAFGLDRTGLDWIRLDSTGSERPRDISEAGTFHLFFFLPYRGMILRVLAAHIFALDSFSSISMGRRMGYWRFVRNGEHRTVKR